ncbi:hypothetical protein BCR34DRAFT_201820 [Clohesyomyces aquaticus]|uniref:Uncharacterized protein n=1 Tax=Clohesyomyces aquaticus TaxID=1231657 RepID=A0A1Y1ZXF4_9PLEO|nr:hypothetical protein BCR34DRAFT_201820 [Clohesyomyces aquaticus]
MKLKIHRPALGSIQLSRGLTDLAVMCALCRRQAAATISTIQLQHRRLHSQLHRPEIASFKLSSSSPMILCAGELSVAVSESAGQRSAAASCMQRDVCRGDSPPRERADAKSGRKRRPHHFSSLSNPVQIFVGIPSLEILSLSMHSKFSTFDPSNACPSQTHPMLFDFTSPTRGLDGCRSRGSRGSKLAPTSSAFNTKVHRSPAGVRHSMFPRRQFVTVWGGRDGSQKSRISCHFSSLLILCKFESSWNILHIVSASACDGGRLEAVLRVRCPCPSRRSRQSRFHFGPWPYAGTITIRLKFSQLHTYRAFAERGDEKRTEMGVQ